MSDAAQRVRRRLEYPAASWPVLDLVDMLMESDRTFRRLLGEYMLDNIEYDFHNREYGHYTTRDWYTQAMAGFSDYLGEEASELTGATWDWLLEQYPESMRKR